MLLFYGRVDNYFLVLILGSFGDWKKPSCMKQDGYNEIFIDRSVYLCIAHLCFFEEGFSLNRDLSDASNHVSCSCRG